VSGRGDCPSLSTLGAFRAGAGEAEESTRIAQHVSACGVCSTFLGTLSPRIAAPAPPVELAPGTRAGRFVIEGRLGAGGMGVVYAARDPELGRSVAVKVLRHGTSAESSARLRREAKALARLAHPNVVMVFESGLVGEQVFVVMELIEGTRLDAWLAERRLGWREALDTFVQAGRGLAAAHRAGIVHRDFKPANVLVGHDGRVRVVDFGLARDEGEGIAALETPDTGEPLAAALTLTGAVVGTPAYMAPEQRRGEPVSARSDQFSFCVSLYEALFGVRPAPGASAPRKTRVPVSIRRAIERGLAPEAADRWPTLDALLDALASRARRHQGRALAGAAGLALAATAVVGATWVTSRPAEPDPCAGVAARLHGVWDAGRKQAMSSAFLATLVPTAAERFRSAEALIDRYAAGWVDRATRLCTATEIRGELSPAEGARRQACLDQRLQGLRAWVGVFLEPTPGRVRNASSAAAALDDLATCDDVALVVRPTPADARLAGEVRGMRDQLASLEVRKRAGEWRAALEALEGLLVEARRLGYRPLEAEVLAAMVMPKLNTGQLDAAQASLDDLLAVAEETRDDQLRARAWVNRVYLYAQQYKPAEAHRAARYTDAVLRPMSGIDAEWQRLMLANAEAHAYWGENLYGEALMLSTAAVARAEQLSGPDDPRLGPLLMTQADLLRLVGAPARARAQLERALANVSKVYGDEHPMVAGIEANLAEVHADLGDRALQLEYGLRAEEHMLAIYPEDHVLPAQAAVSAAKALLVNGRAAEALARLERARTVLATKMGARHPAVADVLYQTGRALIDNGRPDDAVATLETAVELLVEVKASLDDVAAARFALARALRAAGREPARARSLAAAARSGFGATRARERAEVDAWLASRR
jgi:tetratricopeptide (TPR) repeat protein/predicted Ser/Thr protein kinase